MLMSMDTVRSEVARALGLDTVYELYRYEGQVMPWYSACVPPDVCAGGAAARPGR